MSNSLKAIFEAQKGFQLKVTGTPTPLDSTENFIYHITATVEELGEVLKADKRWKTHRNSAYDLDNKKDELADVLISVVNLFLYSGIDAEEAFDLVLSKINENGRNLSKERRLNNV